MEQGFCDVHIYIYITMDLQAARGGDMDWIGLAQDRDSWWALVNAVMNLLVP
jgi:hypothetical protein